jgi:hypothetical protein
VDPEVDHHLMVDDFLLGIGDFEIEVLQDHHRQVTAPNMGGEALEDVIMVHPEDHQAHRLEVVVISMMVHLAPMGHPVVVDLLHPDVVKDVVVTKVLLGYLCWFATSLRKLLRKICKRRLVISEKYAMSTSQGTFTHSSPKALLLLNMLPLKRLGRQGMKWIDFESGDVN